MKPFGTILKIIFFQCIVFISYSKSLIDSNPGELLEHPRLVWLKGEEKNIQKAIETDKNWAKIHQNIISESDKIIVLPTLERIQIGRRLLDKSRECLRRVSYLAYAYRMTKNKKYLYRCEAELLKVSQFSDWNPSHFLDVAEMTLGVAIGYDWLFHDLKAESRKIIKEAILKKGINPSFESKNNSWLLASHNWNQVCNAGMVFGALAIQEDNPKLADEIVKRAETSIKLPLEDYNPDGAYPEGYSYWEYGTSFHVLYLSALKKLNMPMEMNAGFEKTASYFQSLIGNSGKSFNYSDAGSGSASLSATVFWFANHFKDNSLLYNEKTYADASLFESNRILPFAMIWGEGLRLENAPEPKNKVWIGVGKSPVAMMRTSWSNGIYVGFKSGSPEVNHAHMDVGSFVMDALGERWAMDLGMQEYESLESKGVQLWDKKQSGQRWEILRYNNFHHNTLTFDDQLQIVSGKATINSSTNRANFMSATSDISKLYSGSVSETKRGVAIIDEKYMVIKDEIKTNEKDTKVRWNMVTPAKVSVINGNTAILEQNGKKLFLKVLEPTNVEIKTWSTEPKQPYDATNPNTLMIGFETKLPKSSNHSLTVVLIPNQDLKIEKISDLKEWK
jgi:hypothetical protein